MSYPFQCLYHCWRNNTNRSFLVAASSSSLYCFDIASEKLVSVWTPQKAQHHRPNKPIDADAQELEDVSSIKLSHDAAVRPSKRRKVSSADASRDPSTDPPSEDDQNAKAEPIQTSRTSSPVIELLGSRNGQYIITVTDDKCIRVLEFLPDNSLKLLSERSMPKRPCAIALTPNEDTILCADKFGDVYSMPLLGLPHEDSVETENGLGKLSVKDDTATQKAIVPAASMKTVHTLRNREALRHQQAQTKVTAKPKPSNFDRRLLLGHVSMLTDLLCISVSDNTTNPPGEKTYIFTSDRDEHIRISRGTPQTHIIKGFCLGHTEFVSKLCIPRWHKRMLISGGGDDYLLTWNWLSGEILQKINLKCYVENLREQFITVNELQSAQNTTQNISEATDDHLTHIAISGIWAVDGIGVGPENLNGDVVVACEGIPALFMFHLGSDLKLVFREYVVLHGNVLDVAIESDQRMIIYSLDNFHVRFSTRLIAGIDGNAAKPSIGCLKVDSLGHWKQYDILQDAVTVIESKARSKKLSSEQGSCREDSLSSLFYGIENLRKRGQDEPE